MEDARSHIERGAALLDAGRYAAAAEAYRQAARLLSDNPEIWVWLGYALSRAERRKEAVEALLRRRYLFWPQIRRIIRTAQTAGEQQQP